MLRVLEFMKPIILLESFYQKHPNEKSNLLENFSSPKMQFLKGLYLIFHYHREHLHYFQEYLTYEQRFVPNFNL
jgi:hypothetical protein